jgi:hypothetical protein
VTDQEPTDHEAEKGAEDTLPMIPPESERPGALQPRAAIVIGPLIIQSGATPLVGLIMLAVGLVVGYLLRPAMPPAAPVPILAPTPVTRVATVVPLVTATPVASARTPQPASGSPTPNPTELAQRRALADDLASWTRHFKGNANAPVTIIEFSDFQ